jgi:hypothetical protein
MRWVRALIVTAGSERPDEVITFELSNQSASADADKDSS